MAASEGANRDNTEDWVLAEAARPRSFAGLEARIDTAISVAYACEEAMAQVGADAIESAAQARRAAELAERAAIAAEGARALATVPPPPPPAAAAPAFGANPAVYPLPSDEDLRLSHFIDRADRLVARLRHLQQV
jgi:hypothetical protein